ncbi:hypothetical protein DINM_022777 [Dirofilaria immitis]|nr:hypothetical protein [Dirofilaria immitis]
MVVADDSKITELEYLRNRDIKKYESKLHEYKSRTPENERDQTNLWLIECSKLSSLNIQQNMLHVHRDDLSQDSVFAHVFSDEQIALLDDMKLSGISDEDIGRKMEQFYSALPEHKRWELNYKFKMKCVQWIQEVASFNEIQLFLYSVEKENRLVFNALLDEYFERLPNEQQDKLRYIKDICGEMWKKIMNSSRRQKRYVKEEYNEWILWMNDEQKREFQQMRNSGLFSYIGIMETDKQLHITEKTKHSCYAWLDNVTTVEERTELKNLHQTDHFACKRKRNLDSTVRQAPITRKAKGSKQGPENLRTNMTYLSWLTDAQKMKLKNERRRKIENGYSKKIFDYFESLTGDKKKKAAEELQQGCLMALSEIIGNEKMLMLKEIKDSGADPEQIRMKVEDMLKLVVDKEKKKRIDEYAPVCRKIYAAMNERRDKKKKAAEELQQGCLMALSEIIGNEKMLMLKEIKDSGADPEQIRMKVEDMLKLVVDKEKKKRIDEYAPVCRKIYAAMNERRDKKKKAAEELQEGCRMALREIVGEEKWTVLRQMKDSGATPKELSMKVEEMFKDVVDKDKKEKIDEYAPVCRKIFAVIHERRDKKKKAAEELQQGCLMALSEIIGNEKMLMLKEIKDSGADPEQIRMKVEDMLKLVVDKEKKKRIDEYAPVCRKIYAAMNERRDKKKKAAEELQQGCLMALSEIIGNEKMLMLKEIKDSGADPEQIRMKVEDMLKLVVDKEKKKRIDEYAPVCRKIYAAMNERRDKKKKAAEELQEGCRMALREIVGEEKWTVLRQMKDSGATPKELSMKVEEMFKDVVDKDKKEKIDEYAPVCRKIFAVIHERRKRNDHNLESYFQTYLSWLTDAQKMKLKNERRRKIENGYSKKIFDYFESLTGDKKKKAAEELQQGCLMALSEIIGNEKMLMLKEIKDSGADPEQIRMKVEDMLKLVVDKEKKKRIDEYAPVCRKIYAAMNERRDKKKKAAEELQQGCLMALSEIIGNEKMLMLKEIKDSGADPEQIRMKVEDMLKLVVDKEKKKRIDEYAPVCRKIYAAMNERRDKKKKAAEELQEGCRMALREIVGEEKWTVLRQMKDSGATPKELSMKVEEMFKDVVDKDKKEKIDEYAPVCRKIFAVIHERRDKKKKAAEELQQGCLMALSEIIGNEKMLMLKEIKDSGADPEQIRMKVEDMLKLVVDKEKKKRIDEYAPVCRKIYAAMNERRDKKKKAAEELQEGCRMALREIVGEEKWTVLRQMKDSGATPKELSMKVEEMFKDVVDKDKKEKIDEYAPVCRKIFAVIHERRKRNDHNLESYFQTYLSWLTDAQKDEIKNERRRKIENGYSKKIFDYFESLTGDKKKKAAEELQQGCLMALSEIIGNEKMLMLKEIKDSGADPEQIRMKVEDMLKLVVDKEKKKRIDEYAPVCRKIYAAMNERRDKKKKAAEELQQGCLMALSEIIGNEKMLMLKEIKDSGADPEQIRMKVEDMLKLVVDKEKKKRIDEYAPVCRKIYAAMNERQELQEGCRMALREIVGEEKWTVLRQMKDSGATPKELSMKVEEMFKDVVDKDKKEKIDEYAPVCRKIFAVIHERRKRNDHNLESYFQTYLSWLTDAQKDEIKNERRRKIENGYSKKIFDYFESLTGDKKKKAAEELQQGCLMALSEIIGNEKMLMLKEIKDSGADPEQIRMKVEDMLKLVVDKEKKKRIDEYAPVCRKIYAAMNERRKRNDHNLESYFQTYLSWLTDAQKDEIKKMEEGGKLKFDTLREITENGKSKADMVVKGFLFYDELFGKAERHVTDLLYDGCRKILKEIIGGDHYEELTEMMDSGADVNDLTVKVDVMLSQITDEEKSEKIKIYSVKDDGGEHIENRYSSKILHFYDGLSEETKIETVEFFNGVCHDLIVAIFDGETAAELKKLGESSDIANEIRSKMDAIIDKHYFHTHLKWLSEEQMEEIKKMTTEGYASGEAKKPATESLARSCHELFKAIGGENIAHELNVMIRSDIAVNKLEKKIAILIDSMNDESKKAQARLRNELQTTSLAAQDDQVDRFLIEAEQPTQWETITVTKQAEGNVKPAIRRMESQNLEADERNARSAASNRPRRKTPCIMVDPDLFSRERRILFSSRFQRQSPSMCRNIVIVKLLKLLREDVVLVIPVDRFTEEGRNEKWAGVGNLNMWKWLTLEKVDMLNKLFKATNDIALILEKTYAQLLMTDGGLREMAVRSFRETCNELLRVLLGDRNYYLIADMYNFGRTSEEINEKLNQFYMRLSKTNKKYVDMMAPTCKLIYNIYGSPAIRHPRRINEDNLFVKQIHWFTREQETEIETILAEGARNENLLTEMLDYYENLDSLSQEKVSEELKRICQNRVKQLFGTDGLELLKFMNKESISIELLVAKFAQLKIYGIERFDLGKLTSWLSPDQKTELGHLIHDRDISDDAVYERIFEFYEKAEHKKKMDAQKSSSPNVNDSSVGCLAMKLPLKSIPICNRIYLGYKGDCFCNGHSSICSPFTHECLNCADNTFGVQCEKCLDGFEGSALMGEIGCIPAERNNEFAECICNKHSSQCNENGECFFCLHNTTGIQCENCAEGFMVMRHRAQ